MLFQAPVVVFLMVAPSSRGPLLSHLRSRECPGGLQFARGDVIVRQGDVPQHLFVLAKGLVQVQYRCTVPVFLGSGLLLLLHTRTHTH